jgi:hypothetical protein
MTIVLYAMDYSLAGVHVQWDWPETWTVERVASDLLDWQILGYPDVGSYNRSYATAFNARAGHEPRAIGRLDVHVTTAGSISFSRSFPPRYVDSEGVDHVMSLEEQLRPSTLPSSGMHLVRLSSSVVTEAGAQFQLSGSASEEVSGAVYDVAGHAVRELEIRRAGDGHSLAWNGQGRDGRPAVAGVYFVMVRAGGQKFVERSVILR